MTVRLYEVGGCVRDELLGLTSKDVDFAVEAPSFQAMQEHIEAMGLKIFLSKPEFLTIRAGVPVGHELRARCRDADFVMCRKDGSYGNGRHPDVVEPGTLADDLARRDFTVNAIAKDPFTGEMFDPHGGQEDLKRRELIFVGDSMTRIREDGLRILRAMRFSLTKNLTIVEPDVLNSAESFNLLRSVSTERVQQELDKMFVHNTLAALLLLEDYPNVRDAVFSRKGLSLMATMKKRK